MDNLFLILALVSFLAFIVLIVLAVFKRGKGHLKKAGISLVVSIVSFMGFMAAYDETEPQIEPNDSNVADTTAEADTNENDVDDVEPEEPSAESYSIGDLVNVGDVAYTINSIDTATNVGGEWGENSQGTFLIIDVSVTNNGNESLRVDDSFFKLINDGKEFDSDSFAGIIVNDDDSFFLASINPELTLTGKVVFDVSDAVIESNTKQLQVSTGYWGTETELINLQ